jgi:hypothetical protein
LGPGRRTFKSCHPDHIQRRTTLIKATFNFVGGSYLAIDLDDALADLIASAGFAGPKFKMVDITTNQVSVVNPATVTVVTFTPQ